MGALERMKQAGLDRKAKNQRNTETASKREEQEQQKTSGALQRMKQAGTEQKNRQTATPTPSVSQTSPSFSGSVRDRVQSNVQFGTKATPGMTERQQKELWLRQLQGEQIRRQAGLDLDGAARLQGEIDQLEWETGQSIPQRAANILSGAAKGSAANYSSTASTLYEAGQPGRDARNQEMLEQYQADYDRAARDLQYMEEDNAAAPGTWSEADLEGQRNILADAQLKLAAMETVIGDQIQQKGTGAAHAFGAQVAQSSAQDIEQAKKNLDPVGAFLTDTGVAGLQMIGDAALGGALGGTATLPMAMRGFGGGAQTAREDGASLGQQLAYGAGGAAVSVLTEKLGNISAPFAKVFGKGATDDLVEKAISKAVSKLAQSEAGQSALTAALRTGASFLGEGVEEFMESVADPILRRATFDPDARFDLEEALYDFLVGGMLGGIGGGIETVQNMSRTVPMAEDNRPAVEETRPEAPAPDVEDTLYQAALEMAQKPQESVSDEVTEYTTTEQNAPQAARKEESGDIPVVSEAEAVAEERRKGAEALTMERMHTAARETAKKTLGENGYRAFIAEYRDNNNPAAAYGELTRAYNDGLAGRRGGSNVLTASKYNAMFRAGQQDAAASVKAQTAQAGNAAVYGGKSGLDFDDAGTKAYVEQNVDQNTATVIDTVAKALGLKVRFADSVAGGDANAEIENGIITIEKGNPNPVRFLFGHEITHRMQELAPKEYARLRKAVSTSGWTDAAIKNTQRNYAARNRSIGSEAALDEAVADYIGTLMEDDGELERFIGRIRDDRTLLEKLRDAFRELGRKLRGSQYDKQIRNVEKRLSETLDAAVKQVQANEKTQKSTTRTDGVAKFSIRDNFYENIDKWDQKTTGFSFVVGETSEALQKAGIPKKQIRMDATKIVTLLNKHSGMTIDIVRQIPELLEHPVIVIDSKKGSHAKIVMGDLVDTNGKTVTVVLLLTPTSKKGNVLDIIKISSAEGRAHIRSLFFKEDKSMVPVRYVDEKRIHSWLNANRLQLPLHNLGLDSEATLAQPPENVKAGVAYDAETESVSPARLSLKTWNESDYVQERKQAAEEMAKTLGISEKKAAAYIDSVNSIAKMIADDRDRLDYEASPGRSSFVSNAEYGGSFDFSTLCKKRRLLTGTFTAIQKALPNTALTADEILEIRKMMADNGLEVSCGLCYVEGSRANMGGFTQSFIELYKKYNPGKWYPDMAEMNTPDGIEWVRINHPEVYEQYEYFWNHYGTLKDGDPKLFASQQKPKLYQLHTEYQGEILKSFKKDAAVSQKNENGGIRLQSFSDFEIVHLLDTMQVLTDMARVGLAGQAYTKVPDFAWALGDTGLKINLSLIAKGVDENGRLIFDEREGMAIGDAMKLRNRYSENVGTIIVAFNDAQLKAAMADDRIDFIIPFHRSQWKKSQYKAMGLPANTKDYTYQQNEKLIKKTYHEYRGRMVPDKATNFMPNTYWDFSKTGKENAEHYLEMCAKNNKRPKFYKFLKNNGDGSYSLQPDGSTDGYWKLLIDFKMYDNEGKGVPQRPVRPDFNMEECRRMLDEYAGGHANFPVAHGIVDEFVDKYKQEHPKKRYSLKDSDSLAKEIARIQKEGRAKKRSEADVQTDIRIAVQEAYAGMIEEYGAIDPGEKPARDIQMPKKTGENEEVSQTVRTALEAGATPDAAVPTIEELVAKGEFSYDVYTDKQAIADADAKIRSKGYASALADWTADVRAGKVSKANTAMGWALYNNAANAGDIKTAIDILDNMVQHQRNAAQAVQATRILKQLSPEAQLYGVQRSVDNLQKELDERNRETEKRQEQRRQAGKAVRDARQEAAKDIRDGLSGAKVTRRGNRVEVESNQAGEPFVFEYAQKVGEALAKGLSKKTSPKQRTYLQQITAQLKRFAKEKMEKTAGRKALTATELLRDYVQNQEFYAQAWEAAQLELRQTHGNDPALEEFINSGIGVDSSMNPRNAIFMRALVKAAAESQENRGMLAKQSALGFTGMAETIADKLIRDVGAEGSVADTIRDAAAAYVNDVLRESDADQSKLIESAIRSAMKDIGTSLHEIVSAGAAAKATAREAVIGKLVGKYGFGKADATYVADIVGEAFDKMSRERAEKTLESRFKDRPDRKRKSMADLLQEYGNLGAFDAGSRFNEAAAVRIFKSDVALRVNEDLARAFLEAKTEGDRTNILKDIYRDIGRQLPSRFVDKWNAWRYLAMLGNLRTHVRNVGGNAGFAPVVVAKNLTATAIEEAVFRVSGGKLQRSKAFVGFGKSDRALLKAAWDDYDKVEEAALSGGKYSDFANANKYIEEGRVIFKTKALEAARRGNSKALDKEDVWFSRPHYAAAMAGYCKRHGLSPEQIMRGKETANARAYAIKEAQKATYRDTNALSQTISGLGRVQGDNPVRKGLGTVVEGILPFRKTPANILARGIEYSPIGLMNGIKQAVWDVKRGTKTGAEAIDSISAGLTGTGLLALGVYMAAQGLVRGHGSDDDDENEFMELMGHQGYALELPGGSSVTLDWLAPEALPYFIGVNLWEQTKGSDEALTLSAMLNAVKTVTEPLLEMSCLQSLNDVFDAVGYAASDGLDGLPAALASAATSYLTQGLPTILGQAERAGEGVRMTTYTEKNAFLTGDMQYTLGRASARIPGWDYQQIPYIDAWGRMESSGGTAARVGNNFLNPAYTSTVESSPMEDELLRLYEQTGERKVLPSRAAKYFNVDGERKDLTAEEYVKYATAKGQTAYDILSGLTANAAYQSMDDASKAEAVGKVYEYANAVAKTAVSDYEPEGWVAKAIEAQKRTKISPEQYVTTYLAQSGVGSLTDASGKTIDSSHSLLVMEAVYDIKGLTEQQRKQLFDDFGVGKSVRHYSPALVKEKLNEMRKLAS